MASIIAHNGVFYTVKNLPSLSEEELWFIAKAYEKEIPDCHHIQPEYLASLWYHYYYFQCRYDPNHIDPYLERIVKERMLFK